MRMRIEEMVRFPVQLVDVVIYELEIKNDITTNKLGVEPKTELSCSGKVIDDKRGDCYLTVDIQGEQDEQTVYTIHLVLKGICELEDETTFGRKHFDLFLNIRALDLLWPYFREILPSTMIKMGVEPMHVPTIHVLKTLLENNDLGENE